MAVENNKEVLAAGVDMTRVVHLTSVHAWDDVRIFLKECRGLASAGYDTYLVAQRAEDIEVGGVHVLAVPVVQSRPRRMTLTAAQVFWRALKAKGDIYHFHDSELLPWGMLLKVFGKKVIYDVHEDLYQQSLSRHWVHPWFRAVVGRGARLIELIGAWFFDGVVTATPHISKIFPPSKAVLIQNFPIQSELVLSEPMPYLSRAPKFVYVGGIADIRGGREMVRAFGYLADLPDAHLELAGAFSPHSFADELLQVPGWKKVIYRGLIGRQEVARLLGAARAGLVLFQPMPNHVDAQPNKLFEYMSAGLPVIASDFPLWREIVAGASCGLLVDPLDPRAIANALRWVLEHPREAEAMGRRGQEAVGSIYNWEQEMKKMLRLYGKLSSTPKIKT